ncbi:hypothetical protein [Nocardioides jishulii]|uniref:Uncharacterized protein n=1 Tax=Nocardioides jishulii TaxID=2575440 RepID=A0A4U2YJE9_9ACTN|nr:hypothetical protein [Nocardioides jishulii]QCX26803.1 hypothetical protein FCL41_04040 [Nocardioides jishulii]TKI61287.1 hypothetical protein FC770_10675 [Nocardioides jishulii]
MTQEPSRSEPEKREPTLRQQYELGSAINSAWLSLRATSEHLDGLDDAWERFLVVPKWRDWVIEHIGVPEGPFLLLEVRDEPARSRLRKTPRGVTMCVPISEVVDAERAGEMVAYFVGCIYDIYEKWATAAELGPLPAQPC